MNARSVFAADVDGDGDTDVLSASYSDDKIAWYENDGNQNFTEHVISTSADGALSVFAIDVDGDGDIDVLSASTLDDTIAWYENDGNENFTERVISTSIDGALNVFATDVDGDGHIDVLTPHRIVAVARLSGLKRWSREFHRARDQDNGIRNHPFGGN